ncbi:hypothetical protein QE357_000556 [Siphonobacter sp. BAB-5404]|nr:hypothetical protein [Siphonobacter sp. SORGH_AS_0500]
MSKMILNYPQDSEENQWATLHMHSAQAFVT